MRTFAALVLVALAAGPLMAQEPDTTMVQGGIYQRPYLVTAGRTAVGGYAEGHAEYLRTDGVSEGLSMALRRFNIFLFSSVGRRIRFTSELEFEDGTEEIALETALVDFVVNPSFVVRAGILLPPVGAFNVDHDAPRYDFVERPFVSTRIIPATLSEIGFGVHGRLAPRGFSLSYDAYLTNGLDDGVIQNSLGRTDLASGKGEERFAEDNNGEPALSARLAAQRSGLGEVGVSLYHGTYNSFRIDGVRVDDRRAVSLLALDWQTDVGPVSLRGEAARTAIDVPESLEELFASRQWGVYLDAVVPVWRPHILGLDDPVVSAGLRFDHVDQNRGRFSSTGLSIGDETTALTAAISFRPANGTVFRINYRSEWLRDFVGNPVARRAGFALGFATYF